MKAFAAILLGCLALAPSAQPAVLFGVSDDRGKYDDDGGAWFFNELTQVGLQANKMTVSWDPARPDEIAERAFLDRAVPQATARGVHVSFGIHIGKARAITDSPQALDSFVAWLQQVARAYPQVTEFVVGNEPNLTRFWQPQFDAQGQPVAGIAFAAFLARSYDALEDVNPNITVVGVGLSPRGNDMPDAASNVSRSPVRFIRDLGIGYGLLARNKPLMDVFGFHPYPERDRDPLARGYRWPNAGVANLNRIKQAFWDAFNGTAQPTFAEPGLEQERPLTFKLDEVGWQVSIPPESLPAYFGQESVRPTDEQTQAQIYGELIRTISCEPSVREMLFFGLIDEPNLDRWQAALLRADRTRRPAWESVRGALTEVAGGCQGRVAAWRHVERVVGATVRFQRSRVTVRAEEDVLVRVGGGPARELRAYRSLVVATRGRPVVRVEAAMNRDRFSRFR